MRSAKVTIPILLAAACLLVAMAATSFAAPAGEIPAAGDSFCADNVGFGPLGLSSQSPFQSLRLVLVPRPPSTLPRGVFSARLLETLSNIWSYKKDSYLLDYEMLNSRLDVAYGISDKFLVEAAFEDRRYFGGILDGFISDFHHAFGIDQNKRDQYPNGRTVVSILDAEKRPLVSWNGGRAAYSQSAALTLQHNVTCGGRYLPALSWSVTVRHTFWDTGAIDYDRPVDLGFSVAASKRFGDFYAYVAPGFVWYGANRVQRVELNHTQLSCLAGLEWHFAPAWSVLLQYMAVEGACKNLGPFSDPSHEVTLGLKVRLAPDTLLEAGLLENIIVYANSPDFGIHAGITRRF